MKFTHRYREGDTIVARGSVWRVIDRSDDEAESVWAVLTDNPDKDAFIRYDEIEESTKRVARRSRVISGEQVRVAINAIRLAQHYTIEGTMTDKEFSNLLKHLQD